MKAKCKKCGDTVEVTKLREYKTCECGAIGLDYGDGYYYRVCGNPEDFDGEIEGALSNLGVTKVEDPHKPEKMMEEAISSAELVELFEVPKGKRTVFGRDVLPMCTLTEKVWEWFDEKGLKDPMVQFVKMEEECGELAHELTRGRTDTFEVVDSLGDILITVIGLCHHLHIPPAAALSLAYDQIKDRKGKVVDGSFVKEEK